MKLEIELKQSLTRRFSFAFVKLELYQAEKVHNFILTSVLKSTYE